MSSELKDDLSFQDSSPLTQNPSSKYPNIQTSEPLWKRAPTRDVSGKPYADFMMLIPGLRNFESNHLQDTIRKMETVLMRYEKDIVLADLNLKINVLWVTVTPHLGLTTEISALLHHVIPEAKLVSQHSAT
jgi:hypothetical protein